jgi:hypothetical protein
MTPNPTGAKRLDRAGGGSMLTSCPGAVRVSGHQQPVGGKITSAGTT